MEEENTESPEYNEVYSFFLKELDRVIERAAIATNLLKMKQPWIDVNQTMALYVNAFASLLSK